MSSLADDHATDPVADPGAAPTPTVLIVDDDRATQTLLSLAMEEEGYETVGAQNGEQALEEFSRVAPHLVLMDAMMPEMDGFTCCERLRSLPGGRTVPILIITVLDDQESVDRAFAAGTTDYVTKPIYWPVLCQRVRRLVQAGDTERQLYVLRNRLQRAERWDKVMGLALEGAGGGGHGLKPWREMLAIARESLSGDRAGIWVSSSQTWLESCREGLVPVGEAVARESFREISKGESSDNISDNILETCLTDIAHWPALGTVWKSRWGMVVPLGVGQQGELGWCFMGRSQDLPWGPEDQQRWQRLSQVLGLVLKGGKQGELVPEC